MNKQIERDFIRLLKLNSRILNLQDQRKSLVDFIDDELTGIDEFEKCWTQGTVESDLHDLLCDVELDNRKITADFNNSLYIILDKLVGKGNCTIKDYYDKVGKKEMNKFVIQYMAKELLNDDELDEGYSLINQLATEKKISEATADELLRMLTITIEKVTEKILSNKYVKLEFTNEKE